MSKETIVLPIIALSILGFVAYNQKTLNKTPSERESELVVSLNPLSIEALRKSTSWQTGSDIIIEQTLAPGSNYQKYIASYKSEGLKIYALLTIPNGKMPNGGFPVIIFNHGYISPTQYKTTEKYVAYVDGFAKNGYIVFKPDYRGHGNSEGQPEGAYYSPAYTIDNLNAISSIKRYKNVNPEKIGVWGHSMGGNIALRDLVVDPKDIKVAVIWGGVVGSYEDLMYNWQRKVRFRPPPQELAMRNNYRQRLIDQYGDPRQDSAFWNSVDPTSFISDITAPISLHVGGSDEEVPVAFSQSLRDKLQSVGKTVEFYLYQGADHNISQSFTLAMQHSIEFFDKYLKN